MKKPYLLDDKPVTASELIKYAEWHYGCQDGECIKQTSIAAECLRQNNHTVEKNTKEEGE